MMKKCAGSPQRLIGIATLVTGDLAVLAATITIAAGLRLWAAKWFPIDISAAMFTEMLTATLLLPAGFAAVRLYPGYGKNAVERMRARVLVTFSGFGAMILFDYLAQDGQWSRGILLAAAVLALAALPLWDELAIRLLVSRRLWGEPVLVIGPKERRHTVIEALRNNPELGWNAVVEADLEAGLPARVPFVDVALLALPLESMETWLGIDDLPYRRVVLMPELESPQTQWVTARSLGPYLALQIQQNLLVRHNQLFKRGLDLVAGLALLALAAPLIALSAAAIWLVSPGPLFYSQMRVGRNGVPFRMWKLRTMVVDAEQRLAEAVAASEANHADWQRSMKLKDDPRILPLFGRPFRRYSLDELPQLWNVVCGDMSLVGPRPLPDYHAARLSALTNRLRQRVRPGITGLWQVSGRSETSTDELEQLDRYYVRNWSLWLDIHILARTVAVVLQGKGAC